MKLLPTLLILLTTCQGQSLEPRGHTSPDQPTRWHSLCRLDRPPFSALATCRIEDARRLGFENFFRIEVMSPFLRLDVPERFETIVTVAALAEGAMQVYIEGWGEILMVPLDAEMREAQRRSSQKPTKDGFGLETFLLGVTIQPVSDGQYTIVLDHVGRGY